MSEDSKPQQDVVVIGVGSRNCRVGIVKADLFTIQEELPLPSKSLHVLARRLRSPSVRSEIEDMSTGENEKRSAFVSQIKQEYGFLPQKGGQITQIHPRVEKESKKIVQNSVTNILIGKDALEKEGDPNYQVIWPIAKGRLNLHPIHGRTPSAMEADLMDLWTNIIELHCHIKASDFSNFKVMLLVPDQFLRKHIRIMLNVLLGSMKFAAAFIHQESVCAAFGAGLSTACVVDIGHEKLSVSCIDEGISINRSRAYFPYGGKNVQELLCYLLCNSTSFMLHNGNNGKLTIDEIENQPGIITIKESFCHLDISDNSHKLFDFVISGSDNDTVRVFPLNLHHELILAPMGLFYPGMFAWYYEEKYFETNSNYHEPYDCSDPNTYVEMGGTLGRYAEKGPKDKVSVKGIDSADTMSIDEAVVASVRQVGNPELYVKLLSNIVLAGGSSVFPHFGEFLVEKVQARVKTIPELENCKVEVLNIPRQNEPSNLSWKGAAIVSGTPIVQDCWVTNSEWEKEGIAKMREKSCFRW